MTIAINVFLLWWDLSRDARAKLGEDDATRPLRSSWSRRLRRLLAKSAQSDDVSFFVDFLWPVTTTAFWYTSFIVAEVQYTTAGWVSASFTATGALLLPVAMWWDKSNRFKYFIPLVLTLSMIAEIVAILVIVIQRCAPGVTFGSVAYSIINTHGCTPIGSISFLERGARSRVFQSIQIGQVVYSVIILFVGYPVVVWRAWRKALIRGLAAEVERYRQQRSKRRKKKHLG
jgi:hypothetical protein